MSTLPAERKRALRKTQSQIDFYYDERILPYVKRWKLSAADQERFEALAGISGRTAKPRLSDRDARYRAASLMIDRLLRHRRDAARAGLDRRYFFVSLKDEMGNTLDRDTEINLRAFWRKIDTALRGRIPSVIALPAIFVIELQAINNYPEQGRGRMLMFNAHGVAWTDDPHFDADAWAAALNASGTWHCELGAKPIVISELTSTRSLARATAYMLKVPHDCKRRVTYRTAEKLRKKRPDWAPRPWPIGDGYELVDTRKGYRADLALRILEGLSQLLISDVVYSVGKDAQALRSEWKTSLVRWHRSRRHGGRVLKASFDVSAWWRRIRRHHGSNKFEPYAFLTGAARPGWVHPMPDPLATLEEPSVGDAFATLRAAMKNGPLADL